jgi:hypothetical protein
MDEKELRMGIKKAQAMKKCDHTWYMREPGIQCTKCLEVWESDDK